MTPFQDEEFDRTYDDVVIGPSAGDTQARLFLQESNRERARRAAKKAIDAEERAQRVLPMLETLDVRLARPHVETPWRIEGWQRKGHRIIAAAQFKTGKTTLRDNLARSLVDGEAFLDRFPVQPLTGTLAVLDTEMGSRQFDEWLRDQNIKHPDRVFALPMRGQLTAFDIFDPAIRAHWAQQFRTNGVEYLMLDNLRPLFDALGLDENHEAGRFLTAFDQLLDESEIRDAFVVHHMGHVGERSRGDSRLRDWPDAEWKLVRQDEAPNSARFLSAYGRDVDQAEVQLEFNSVTRRLSIVGGSRHEARSNEALEAISRTLQAAGEAMSGRAIIEALKDTSSLPRKAFEDALGIGVRTGALTCVNGAKRAKLYSVPQCPAVPRAISSALLHECPVPFRDGTLEHTPADFRFDASEAFGARSTE